MSARTTSLYDRNCRRCPRLAAYLEQCRARYPGYWCRPVPSFGDERPRIVLIGLAPGLHGANRTARPFTGDFAGILLYQTLYRLGLATRRESVANDDGLKLRGVRIVNAVKCAPPANKPLPEEIRRCNAYLQAELARLTSTRVLVALGRIGHDAALLALGLKRAAFPFGHGREHVLGGALTLIDSYHCSRYNTQTGRLTERMFGQVLERAVELAKATPARP
ncbi:MAG TPA: uracil-DNA glycosylase [Steroidobacteraceae bacterium]|nr:uracil-DNA glycosylase [Steroidobacteraceae bacterium]